MIEKHEFNSGDLRVRSIRFTEVGDRLPEHDHNFPHTTIVFSGKFRIKARLGDNTGPDTIFHAPASVLIPAEAMHSIECVEPGEVWCTYCHRDPVTGEPVPEYNHWQSSYV